MTGHRVITIFLLAIILAGITEPIASLSGDVAAGATSRQSAETRMRAVEKALSWLAATQQTDGSFGQENEPLTTARVAQAFLVGGKDAWSIRLPAGHTAAHVLANQAGEIGDDAYEIAQVILGVVALGENPLDFASRDWLADLQSRLQNDGRYLGGRAGAVETQAAAIAALRGAYQAVPPSATSWLKSAVNPNGGWGSAANVASDTYHTGRALQALMLAGEPADSVTVRSAVDYLQQRQTSAGGFAPRAGESQQALLATSAAILGLVAAGETLLDAPWSRAGGSAFDALLKMQDGDGSFPLASPPNDGESRILATVVAMEGLVARRLPLRERKTAARQALAWLRTQQRHDGGFGLGQNPSPSVTADAVYAIALAGEDPAAPAWTPGTTSALSALATLTPTYVGGAGNRAAEAGKVARAVAQAKHDPRAFAGQDLVSKISAHYDSGTGRYHPTWLYRHNLAILGLIAAGEPVPPGARQTLLDDQGSTGGWGWAFGAGESPDVDTTGLTLYTLVLAGTTSGSFQSALSYLMNMQFQDASFPDRSVARMGNSNSTALAILGQAAAGQGPRRSPFVKISAQGSLVTPVDALLAWQEDDGAIIYTREFPESRLMAVLDAIPALVSDYPDFLPDRWLFLPFLARG